MRKIRVNKTPAGTGAAVGPPRCSGGLKKLINFVNEDPKTSSDEDCDAEPNPGFSFR